MSGKIIIGMTMSLDGFVNDRNGDVGLLYPDFEALCQTDELLQEAMHKTGAVMGGADIFQQCLNKSLADEIHLSIAPTLLGQGLKLFERINTEAIELKSTGVIEYAGLTVCDIVS